MKMVIAHYSKSLALSALLFAGTASALDIQGSVMDEAGNPVLGAKLSLGLAKVSTTSAANGLYELNSTSSIRILVPESNGIQVRNGQIALTIYGSEKVDVELLSVSGAKIQEQHLGNLSMGNHVIPVSDRALAREIAILKITKGSSTSKLLYNPVNGQAIVLSSIRNEIRSNTKLAKSASGAVDTLFVSAEGFQSLAIPLNATQDQIKLTLSPASTSPQDGILLQKLLLPSSRNNYALASIDEAKCTSCELAPSAAKSMHVQFDAYSGYKKRLATDSATVFELNSYTIHTNKLIELSRDSVSKQLIVTNWVPRDLHHVVVVGEIQGKQVRIMDIDTLRGLSRMQLDLPWELGVSKLQTADGSGVVDITGAPTESLTVAFDYIPQDELQQSIKGIKLNWTLVFNDRVMTGGADVCRDASVVWRPNHPQDVRYMLSFMINAAQAVSHPKFYEFWMKTAFISWNAGLSDTYKLTRAEYDTYTDKEKAQYDSASLDAGKYYNKKHREETFTKYFNKYFSIGMTGGGGLGGGATLGVNHSKIAEQAWSFDTSAANAFDRDDWYLPSTSSAMFTTPWNIYGHEAGHALGFSHQSSYCVRANNSHIAVGTIVYTWLMAQGKSIVTKETMVGREVDWEKDYDANAIPYSSRPKCDDAFEWGGPYGYHAIKLPIKNSPEWVKYLEEHKAGRGLDYLKSLGQ